MTILARLVLALCGLAMVTAILISLMFTQVLERLTLQAEEDQLAGLFENLKADLSAEGYRALTLATLVARNPVATAAFAAGDRDALLAMYRDGFETLSAEFGVRQFQFHAPPAVSFVRIHKPEKFGDDLSGFRKTVIAANRVRATIQGLERGVAGLGMRGVTPVSHEGEHIGSVEFGLSFGQPFFESFAETYGVEVALYLRTDAGGFEPFANTHEGVQFIPEDRLATALSDGQVIQDYEAEDLNLAVMAQPIHDYEGRSIGVATIALDAAPYHARIASARWLAVIATGVTLVVALIAGYLIARGIAGPVKLVTEALTRLSARDFSMDLPDRKGQGEIARMLVALRAFRDQAMKVDAAEREQHARLAQVEAAQTRLGEQARQNLRGVVQAAMQANEAIVVLAYMMRDVNRTNAQAQSMASAVEEMVTSTREISESSDTAAEDAEGARGAADEGVSSANRAVSSMQSIHAAVTRAGERVDVLAQASAQIGEIVKQIEDIAAQTNLLALNATIEAARAGEAGKGFAVVANEVKGLANQTARATEDIRGRIETLRAEMTDIIDAMGSGATAVEDGREVVTGLGGQLGTIAETVAHVTEKMRDIASILSEQTLAAGQVSEGTTAIAELARMNTEEIEQAMHAMDEATGELNQQVSMFANMGGIQVLIEVAKNDHVTFKKRIVDSVIGRMRWAEQDIPDHTTCRLGKWAAGVDDPALRDHPAFRALEQPHKDVHRLGKDAARKAANGDIDGAIEMMGDLNDASHRVIEALNALGRAVEGMEKQ
ncbi:methyl-accepting chemotaxis protein [Roseospira navarrensis]|uniref:HAMP domain-containing protein n=1 Tax=Roseospira navarrensis TaxID=140058 RepID=A0A7X2D2C1_9PROT|nr:methyl-accepting chemotaxis protein [Roseospira navarrensis]MQX35618.1 HAMP domain-containing protein [Roseospira navarrensis]